MQYSKLLGKSVEQNSKKQSRKTDDIDGVQYLVRAGFLKEVSTGRYVLLPLGQMVLNNLTNLMKEASLLGGFSELSAPFFESVSTSATSKREKSSNGSPSEPIDAASRDVYMQLLKRFQISHKELPISIFNVSCNAIVPLPASSILRVDSEAMKFVNHRIFCRSAIELETCQRSLLDLLTQTFLHFAQLPSLSFIPVLCAAGAEPTPFETTSVHRLYWQHDTGDKTYFACDLCGYAAEPEVAVSNYSPFIQPESEQELKEREDVLGVGLIGADKLAEYLNIDIKLTTKTLLFQVNSDRVVAAMIRGDYDVCESKLRRFLNLSATDVLQLAPPEIVQAVTGCVVGYAGPIGLASSVEVVADVSCANRINFEVGANRENYHTINANFDRDFPTPSFCDIRLVQAGDGCSQCNAGTLLKHAGFIVGAVKTVSSVAPADSSYFSTRPLFTDDSNKQVPMLHYICASLDLFTVLGIAADVSRDLNGFIWPAALAPHLVYLVDISSADAAQNLCRELTQQRISVLWDDRNQKPAKKFSDSDLIGNPVRLLISAKTGGQVEFKLRHEPTCELIDVSAAISRILALRR
eukprot:GILK01007629.1.p1 GENE.GILK01007629.1~~GILK01007629.1.p1  ORF type:complete len:588 (+),score=104.95 GILK01007629.1:26-1765(+)